MKIPNITEVPSESLVELVVKSVYEGDGKGTTGTKVLGISNLTIGVPAGGWTCNAAIVTKGEEDTLECVYDGERYRDTVVDSLSDVDEQQTDAADTFTPPDSARANAQQVLDWREQHGEDVEGMTAVGWTRARQLASGEPISLDTVKRIAQFNRHRQNYEKARARQKEEGSNPWEYAGIVAWLGWGGSTGVDWAIGVSAKTDAWDDRADADDILEYLVGWRADAPKGGKKKRTEKPKCTKGRSCGMSCIPQNRKCKADLSPAADVVAKSVASSGGAGVSGGQSQPETKPKATKPKANPKAKATKPSVEVQPPQQAPTPQRKPTPLNQLNLPQGVEISESVSNGVSSRNYDSIIDGNLVRVTFDAGPSGVISSNFLVNDSFDQGTVGPSIAKQIQSTITQIVKADISSREDGAKYTGEAWTGDGQGGFREAMYAKMGFSLGGGSEASPGKGQYGVVQNGVLVPSNPTGVPLSGDALTQYKSNLREALRQGVREARAARENPEDFGGFF